jgi:hypothetical protein
LIFASEGRRLHPAWTVSRCDVKSVIMRAGGDTTAGHR